MDTEVAARLRSSLDFLVRGRASDRLGGWIFWGIFMAAKEPLSALPRTHMGGILTGHGAARCRVRKVWGLLDDCTSVECNAFARWRCPGQVSGEMMESHREPVIRLGVDSRWVLSSITPGRGVTGASHQGFPAAMSCFGSF